MSKSEKTQAKKPEVKFEDQYRILPALKKAYLTPRSMELTRESPQFLS